MLFRSRAAIRIVVLDSAADAIRIGFIVADAVDLRQRDVVPPVPRLTAIDRNRSAAVVGFDEALPVARDPKYSALEKMLIRHLIKRSA